MVDFEKRIQRQRVPRPTDPIELYDRLDRASDKGPLRPVQKTVLETWNRDFRDQQDVILKLHTGQGKTLIGLVMLQARLNEGKGAAVYLCPNNYLVAQTAEQAQQFGIAATPLTGSGDIPAAVLDAQTILVTSVQKFFNGRSKFGIGVKGVNVGTLVLDDSHACVDSIKEQTMLRLDRRSNAFQPILDLFTNDLKGQGLGTFAGLANGDYGALLPVPYWAWQERIDEVTEILATHAKSEIVWPLLQDLLTNCQCLISGTTLEIIPHMPPLDQFPSYSRAGHRVFMSATVTDDSFLVKGLGLRDTTITQPLVDPNETWSGEKMIIIPSLIDPSLTRETILGGFTPSLRRQGKFGVVALTPSFAVAADWGHRGALVAKKDNIETLVDQLRRNKVEKTVVFANRYDGVDLPDAACRVLIVDSLPQGETLLDRYHESCRPDSEAVLTRITRSIEQGLGRSVRGEKDYSVFVLIGPELVRHIQTGSSRDLLSDQTRTQIEIGLEIANLAIEDLETGRKATAVFGSLVNQCLARDEGWKAFYAERMNEMQRRAPRPRSLEVFASEAKAERQALSGDVPGAVKTIQRLIDAHFRGGPEKGWYLQEIARYSWMTDRAESDRVQAAAHALNHHLLKPRTGVKVKRMANVSQRRMERIIAWVTTHKAHSDLMLVLDELLARLTFGVKADRFESALNELAVVLGFSGERPDHEWGAGPDNLWDIGHGEYILWECKNEVKLDREVIHKDECGQMANASAWFGKEYGDLTVHRRMIIPASECAHGAGFDVPVEAVRPKELEKLKKAVRKCYQSLAGQDLEDLSEAKMQALVNDHDLDVPSLVSKYSKRVRG